MRCRKFLVVTVAALAMLSLSPDSVVPGASSASSISSMELAERGPITIGDNSEFTLENGVVSGTGSKSDPYIIEGWKIGPYPDINAIYVHSTTAHFRIRNVYVYSCSIAVYMHTVDNGRVENSQFINDSLGVMIFKSDNCKVNGSVFEGCTVGISISYSDASQSDNTFINCANDVVVTKRTTPWEMTWVGAVVCGAVGIPLVIIVAFLLYFRIKRIPPPSG